MKSKIKILLAGAIALSTLASPSITDAKSSVYDKIGRALLSDAVEYKGHYYKVFEYSMSWNSAMNVCRSLGGYLATITSERENEVIKRLFMQDHNQEAYWIGGYKDRNSNWSWVTGEAFEYSHWAHGEPNNSGGDENRLEYFAHTNSIGTWNDRKENFNHGFICEWE